MQTGDQTRQGSEGTDRQESKKVKHDKGSFLLVDFHITVKETGEVVDTTFEEEAKKAGIYNPSARYEPRLVILGEGMVLRAIEEELSSMDVGETRTFEIPPERAFGQRDPSKIKIYPIRRFKDIDGPLTVGARVNIDGREGVIRSIGSGRVQVDFNPYLAGKTLVCMATIRKILTDDFEKIKYIVHNNISDVDIEKFQFEVSPPDVTILVPSDAYLLPTLQMAKRVIAKEVCDHISGIERVKFVEIYTKGT